MDEPGAYLRANIARRTRAFWVLIAAYFVGIAAFLTAWFSGHLIAALIVGVATACLGIAANDTVTVALRWIRGERAEAAVRGVLEELRRDGYLVVHDVMFGGMGNLDHVVFGANGVFLVETKANRYEMRQLGRVKRQAKLVHDEVGSWVTPVLCAGIRSKTYEHNRVLICGRNNVVDAIRSHSARGAASIDRVRAFLDRYAT